MVLKNKKVGVLMGGVSSEREISLISGKAVAESLKRSLVDVVEIDITSSDVENIKKNVLEKDIDIAFIALHGEFGEDGQVQKILEDVEIAYTGSKVKASNLAMDKYLSKKLFIENNIPTADFKLIEGRDSDINIDKFPVVVKPNCSGSSLGVTIVNDENKLKEAVDYALNLSNKVVVEKYIKGREFTVGILDDRPLAVVEIVPKLKFYDYETKYSDDNLVDFIVPAPLEKNIYEQIRELGLSVHKALGARFFSRVDFILDEDQRPYVLELNSIPGFTTHSLLPLSAKACGIDFDNLILKITESVVKYGKEKTQKV